MCENIVRESLAVALRMKIIFLALLLSVSSVSPGSADTLSFSTPGLASVTLPACTIEVQCWGAGGNGENGWNDGIHTEYGGGGGGGYSQWNGTLSSGT